MTFSKFIASPIHGLNKVWKRSFSSTRYVSGEKIVSLNPARMARKGQRICDLSGKTVHYFSVPTSRRNDLKARFVFTRRKDSDTGKPTGTPVPFPKDTRGVFYYHRDPTYPPISGELRFRLCNTPARFKSGTDLHNGIGEPWNVPLYHLSKYSIWAAIRDLLLDECLVDKSLVSDVAKLPLRAIDSRLLYRLDQPFVVDVEKKSLTFCLLTRKSFYSLRLTSLFCQQRGRRITPYRGLFKARFEMSTLPEHRENPGLVFRFLEQLSPLECNVENYDGFVFPPRPGELLTKKTRGGHARPWHYPLDSRMHGLGVQSFLAAEDH